MIGERIAYIRQMQGMTQRDLGETLGVSVTAISRIERNLRIPSLRLFLKMKDKLEASSLDDLVRPLSDIEKAKLARKLKRMAKERSERIKISKRMKQRRYRARKKAAA